MTRVRVPIREPLDMRTVWEHTPLDYYRCGEYPRFLRPVDAHAPRWEWRSIPTGPLSVPIATESGAPE